MAETITATTQLSLFTVLRDIIRTNATLSARFRVTDFYEFEPHHKSGSFRGFPYFVIRPVTTDTEFLNLDHTATDKEFEFEIILRMEYLARDNFTSYANALINVIESATSTLESSGYYNHTINVRTPPDVVAEDEKELIECSFVFRATGFVDR